MCAHKFKRDSFGGELIRPVARHSVGGRKGQAAFTLVELLVVISIISLMTAIIVPSLNVVMRKAESLRGMNNLKQVGVQLDLFANDHQDRYPPSVATVGLGKDWNWYDPRRLVGSSQRTPTAHRSMSAYLKGYIEDASLLACPSAPQEYPHLEAMWAAGDAWDNPDTPQSLDPMKGSYCFYWNYEGMISQGSGDRSRFRGPIGPASSGKYSKLLVSDYYGKGTGHDGPPPLTFTSCEMFAGAAVNSKENVTAYWTRPVGLAEAVPVLSLKAVYTDGHVGTYGSDEVVEMSVIKARSRTAPEVYGIGDDRSPGLFFLPADAMH